MISSWISSDLLRHSGLDVIQRFNFSRAFSFSSRTLIVACYHQDSSLDTKFSILIAILFFTYKPSFLQVALQKCRRESFVLMNIIILSLDWKSLCPLSSHDNVIRITLIVPLRDLLKRQSPQLHFLRRDKMAIEASGQFAFDIRSLWLWSLNRSVPRRFDFVSSKWLLTLVLQKSLRIKFQCNTVISWWIYIFVIYEYFFLCIISRNKLY